MSVAPRTPIQLRAFVPPALAAVRLPRPPCAVARVPCRCGFLTLRAPGCSCSLCGIGRLETILCVPGRGSGLYFLFSLWVLQELRWVTAARAGVLGRSVPSFCPHQLVPLTLGMSPALERLLRKDVCAGECGVEALGLHTPQGLPWPPQAAGAQVPVCLRGPFSRRVSCKYLLLQG